MKKIYMEPEMRVVEVKMQRMICTSGDRSGVRSRYDIGYGGIDEDGGLDPD